MKKTLIYYLLLLSSFGVVSCGEDEDDNPQPVAIDPAASITGKWLVTRMEQRTYDSNTNQVKDTQIETIYPNQAITFTSPDSFLEQQTGSNPRQAAGTFSHSNNTVSLNIPTPLFIYGGTYQVDTLTSTRLVFQITVPASGPAPKYNRIIRANRQ